MIDQQLGWSPRKIDVRVHSDNIRRVTSRTNSYYYAPVNGTSYSLAISLPEPYGHFRVEGQIEVKRREENYTQYFRGKDWRVHPDWVYCDNPITSSSSTNGQMTESPEETIRAFLEQPSSNLRWRNPSNRPTAYEQWSCEYSWIPISPLRIFLSLSSSCCLSAAFSLFCFPPPIVNLTGLVFHFDPFDSFPPFILSRTLFTSLSPFLSPSSYLSRQVRGNWFKVWSLMPKRLKSMPKSAVHPSQPPNTSKYSGFENNFTPPDTSL